MARKTQVIKTPPATRGPAAASHRQSTPATTALYVAQLRPHGLKFPPAGARQQIRIQVEEQSQAPRVVKIIHTDSI